MLKYYSYRSCNMHKILFKEREKNCASKHNVCIQINIKVSPKSIRMQSITQWFKMLYHSRAFRWHIKRVNPRLHEDFSLWFASLEMEFPLQHLYLEKKLKIKMRRDKT